MAEEIPDPREVDWHPRRRTTLHGHGEAGENFLRAWRSGKLHHAWLISWRRGIGKATLAYRLGRFLLAHPAADATSLQVAAEDRAARQVEAATHPDLFVLQRAFDGKKIKSEIAVDDARGANDFFAHTAVTGGWRVAVVDAADDLNVASANALLKLIEEPPRRSIILIVTHRPGALLRTIRSRCIELPLAPLSLSDTLAVLREIPPTATTASEALTRAAELSEGSPGRALDLVESKGAKLFADLKAKPQLTKARCVELSQAFGGRDSAADYQVFAELLVGWIADTARQRGLSGGGAGLAKAHDDIVYSLRQTDALNLDRRQTVVDALLLLEAALKAS
ncbi:MAG: DNA polymerase III subunit delta' [Rhizobiales bacterium]|nr:DNA polymerase III subunit delta' [Hyphomicrobiales bacterium]